MRPSTWFVAALVAGCHPSATVENTMPIANLQTYGTVSLRVQSTIARGEVKFLENSTLAHLQSQCRFKPIARRRDAPADVLVDLSITGAGRGGTGIMRNPNLATVDTLLVLTDGQSGELLGTARIHGQSSGLVLNAGGGTQPETEALDVVAQSVAGLLAKSGCGGPLVAKVDTPPPPPPPIDKNVPPPPPVDETKRPDAEKLNEDGKEKLRGADTAGALALFQQANSTLPDARYEFNVCLAYEASEDWTNAAVACKQARSMNPPAKLVEKIDGRLTAIQSHH